MLVQLWIVDYLHYTLHVRDTKNIFVWSHWTSKSFAFGVPLYMRFPSVLSWDLPRSMNTSNCCRWVMFPPFVSSSLFPLIIVFSWFQPERKYLVEHRNFCDVKICISVHAIWFRLCTSHSRELIALDSSICDGTNAVSQYIYYFLLERSWILKSAIRNQSQVFARLDGDLSNRSGQSYQFWYFGNQSKSLPSGTWGRYERSPVST